ncbi:MAG: NosD domain-containing protein [Planctomycetota bacterium]
MHNARIIAVLALTATTTPLLAGPITPPAGAVTSTGKTTDQIEPRAIINAQNTPGDANNTFIISQPGSYYLTGDITGESGKNGIRITANDVTIDLNGFTVRGMPAAGDGIVTASADGLNLKNGRITDWGGSGVFNNGKNCTYTDLIASNNTNFGLTAGDNSIITRCTTDSNLVGISPLNRSRVSNCVARDNTDGGIEAGRNSIISGCIAEGNATGFNVSFNSLIKSCSARGNTLDGFQLSSRSTIVDSSATDNAGTGVFLFTDSLVQNCKIVGNDTAGIRVQSGCTIRDNHLTENRVDGANSTPAILLSSGDNLVEGNQLVFNNVGIRATGASNTGNIIIGNAFRAHTNAFELSSGSHVIGTTITPPLTQGFTGNSTANSGFGTIDPWGNIIF